MKKFNLHNREDGKRTLVARGFTPRGVKHLAITCYSDDARGSWSISHVPSGCRVFGITTQSKCRTALAVLVAELPWLDSEDIYPEFLTAEQNKQAAGVIARLRRSLEVW